jgi:phenylalanyl-tRNA synthetase beta chain
MREVLTGVGLTEVINYAFVSGAQVDAPAEGRVRLRNPLTEDQDTLRTSLVMPGLVSTLRSNVRLGRRDAAVFEIGRVFLPAADGAPREEPRLAILLAGQTHPHHWSVKSRPFDLFDAKGIADLLLLRLGLDGVTAAAGDRLPAFLHPGRSFALAREGGTIGWAGVLHPDTRAAWELRDEVVVLEIATAGFLDEAPKAVRFTALDRFPAVERDLSIVCDESVPAAEIDARVRGAAGARLRSVSLVDRYTGNQVPAGKVSLTVSLRFQDPERTLTSDEVQQAVDRVLAQLRAAGCEIRA